MNGPVFGRSLRVRKPEIWDFWAFGLCSSSGILKDKIFRKQDLFPSSGEGVGTPTLLGPLEWATLNNWKRGNFEMI
jgi:hypothetical protein